MIPRPLLRAIEWLLVALLGVMVVLVFGNVVLRYGFNSGITFSEEVSRFLDLPRAEVFLRELFEQFRKFNCQVSIVAQSYSRLADTHIRVALVGNTRGWMIFNTGSREDVERLGRDFAGGEDAAAQPLRDAVDCKLGYVHR